MLTLRLRARATATGGPIAVVTLASEFYTLKEIIDVIDRCVDNSQTIELLTASYESFHLDPANFGAIGVVEV